MKRDFDLTDAQAMEILDKMHWQAGTLSRALDQDGDGMISAEDFAAAPDVLRHLIPTAMAACAK